MENPVEILYSWQALLVAISAAGFTQLVKTIYDIWRGQIIVKETASIPPPPLTEAVRQDPVPPLKPKEAGKDFRKSNVWINRIVLPAVPIAVGALIAALIPLRPEVLSDFVEARVPNWWEARAVYAVWGAACGQFADYVFTKVKPLIKVFFDKFFKTTPEQVDR